MFMLLQKRRTSILRHQARTRTFRLLNGPVKRVYRNSTSAGSWIFTNVSAALRTRSEDESKADFFTGTDELAAGDDPARPAFNAVSAGVQPDDRLARYSQRGRWRELAQSPFSNSRKGRRHRAGGRRAAR